MKIDLLLDNLKSISVSKLDDALDRLYYLYTSLLLVFFVFCTGLQQTFKKALNCKPEANFPGTWVEYVDNYCYITGTFHTRSGSNFDLSEGHTPVYVNYYQWVPYVLAAQALSFYLPHLIYLVVAKWSTPFNVKQIVDSCHDVSSKSSKAIDEKTADIAKSVFHCSTLGSVQPNSMGRKLVSAYLLFKILNFVTLLANIYLITNFVGEGNYFWALQIVENAVNGIYWDKTGFFPRVSYCNVELKTYAQPQSYTIQCLLNLNILNEKVFAILYFWFMALLLVSLFNFAYTFFELLLDSEKPPRYVKSLKCFTDKKEELRKFWQNYVSKNGSLLLRFVEEHAGIVVASKLAEALAEEWLQNREAQAQPPVVHVAKSGAN